MLTTNPIDSSLHYFTASNANECALSSGCSVIDRFLGCSFGLIPGQITEIYGESRSGKTSLAIQFLIQATVRHLLDGDERFGAKN
jgi:RecA/RadA recombinase